MFFLEKPAVLLGVFHSDLTGLGQRKEVKGSALSLRRLCEGLVTPSFLVDGNTVKFLKKKLEKSQCPEKRSTLNTNIYYIEHTFIFRRKRFILIAKYKAN